MAFGHLKICLHLLHLLKIFSIVYGQCGSLGANDCDCYRLLYGRLLKSDLVGEQANDSQTSNLLQQRDGTGLALRGLKARVSSQQAQEPIILWPGGIIFYLISSQFSSGYTQLIRESITMIEKLVGREYLQFVEAKTSSGEICRKHYINIMPTKEPTCVALIGMQLSGTSDLWLSEPYCKYHYAVMLEVLHAIGRVHEHLRPDRDNYININLNKIFAPACPQFNPPDLRDQTVSLPYDYESVMHYDSCAGSCDGNYVMTRRRPNGAIIYSNRNMTELDVKTIEKSVPGHLEFREARDKFGAICRKTYLKIEQTIDLKCVAEIGMQFHSPTHVWLNQRACNSGTIIHELIHALGRHDEQCRPDRDYHVTLIPSAIISTECLKFAKVLHLLTEQDPTIKLDYDTESIMHYGSCTFSCRGNFTIVRRDGGKIEPNRMFLTPLDVKKLQVMFPKSSKIPYVDAMCNRVNHRAVGAVLIVTVLAITVQLMQGHKLLN